MKKVYYLLFLFVTLLAYGQSPDGAKIESKIHKMELRPNSRDYGAAIITHKNIRFERQKIQVRKNYQLNQARRQVILKSRSQINRQAPDEIRKKQIQRRAIEQQRRMNQRRR